MKTFTVLFAVLLVALFITTEAKPWGRPGRGNNRPGRPGKPSHINALFGKCQRPVSSLEVSQISTGCYFMHIIHPVKMLAQLVIEF